MYMTDLIFRSQDTFIPELNDSNSPAFKERVLLVIAEIEPIYKKKYPSSFIRVLVKRFSQGSIITETQLVFNSTAQIPTVQEVLDTLLSAVLQGGADPLKILPASISVNGSVIATTTVAASTSTVAALTTSSSGLKIESSLLQITWLFIMAKILRGCL
ncbi:uncharacterized protein si:ch211-217k17.9 [Pimephales promelas]|uniref:uncharacterized protein si:ch211-217k17.9 n=1 Tax=Pimephales promelas TaxID=90988 RepID=UPI001955BCE9|nr:uncharacterized protein si:ch211-217k17.9 [Pimephales promelas]